MGYVLIALAVVAGATAQRVSGMGFALVVAPVLVVVVGPVDGVLIVNVCGAASASLVTIRLWRHIDWRQYLLLVLPALAALGPGVLLALRLGGPSLQVVVGGLLVLVLTASLLITRSGWVASSTKAALACGAASGLMSATAGASGPSVGIYSVLTKPDHRTFSATIQPFFVTLGIVAFVSKVLVLPTTEHSYSWWLWPLIITCTVVGLATGERVVRWVDARLARLLVLCLAYAGAVVAIIDGLVELNG